MAHLRAHLAFGFLVLAAAFFLWKRFKTGWLATAGAVVSLILVVPPLFNVAPRAKASSDQPTLRVFAHNVGYNSQDQDAVVRQIREADADVVVVLEVTAGWQQALKELFDEYQFDISEARESNFGIMLLSRFPVIDQKIEDFSGWDLPSITAEIDFHGERVVVIGTHPPPPVARDLWEVRNWHLESLARSVRLHDSPVLVCGDFNATPWSAAYRKLLTDSGLRSVVTPLLPSWRPLPIPFLGIPCDHQLVSDEFRVVRRIPLDYAGSDHRAFVIEVQLESQ